MSPISLSGPQATPGAADHPQPAPAEISRRGESFVFRGRINGSAVQFRISETGSGIAIPRQIAASAGVVGTTGPANLDAYVPIQSLFIGGYPVTAVMARLTTTNDQYVEIGLDALASFKVVMANGRRVIVPN
jgi:hypothetical protein